MAKGRHPPAIGPGCFRAARPSEPRWARFARTGLQGPSRLSRGPRRRERQHHRLPRLSGRMSPVATPATISTTPATAPAIHEPLTSATTTPSVTEPARWIQFNFPLAFTMPPPVRSISETDPPSPSTRSTSDTAHGRDTTDSSWPKVAWPEGYPTTGLGTSFGLARRRAAGVFVPALFFAFAC